MSDCLGHLVGLKTRYVDIVCPPPEETRAPEEIISNIRKKLSGNEGGET